MARHRKMRNAVRIILPHELIEPLMSWHGGQWSAVYSLASTAMDHPVSADMITDAIAELESDAMRARGKQKRELRNLIGELDAIVRFPEEHEYPEDNPRGRRNPTKADEFEPNPGDPMRRHLTRMGASARNPLQSGYAYEYTGRNWRGSSDEDWETISYTPTGGEKFVGYRTVDGSQVAVYKAGGRYIAQLAHMARPNPRGRRNPLEVAQVRFSAENTKRSLRRIARDLKRARADGDRRRIEELNAAAAFYRRWLAEHERNPRAQKAPLARVGGTFAKGLRFGAAVHIGATTKSGQRLPGTWIVVKRQGQRLVVMHPKTRALASVPRTKVTLANPQPSPAQLERARRDYQDFHWGTKPTKQVRVKVPRPSGKLWAIGKLHSAAYTTTKGREGRHTWEHEFGEGGGKKPTLATDGKRLFVVGGSYKIKPEGITG